MLRSGDDYTFRVLLGGEAHGWQDIEAGLKGVVKLRTYNDTKTPRCVCRRDSYTVPREDWGLPLIIVSETTTKKGPQSVVNWTHKGG